MAGHPEISFDNTANAFRHKSNAELKKAALLFKSFNFPILLKVGPALAKVAVFLGFKGLIKNTIFAQFCGGETIEESSVAIQLLTHSHVGTILDYSVEGEETETVFKETCAEIIKTIHTAAGKPNIPFSVFKTTGIIRFALLEKVSNGITLNADETKEWAGSRQRFESICKAAFDKDVRLFVDAEESWIQNAIDQLAEEMMAKYNTHKAIVFNTIQMYRHDRLAYLQNILQSTTTFLGFKIVRGAYMEKERERAAQMGYQSPIQPDKASCDRDYDAAVDLCLQNIQRVAICAGTHNEASSMLLANKMAENNIQSNDERIWFSQLLGMSDHISFNLAHAGYNVAKYVPYGPVLAVIPYLTRRARENSSVAGQVGRELRLIQQEMVRRKSKSA